jgi:hypothetical protein
MDRFKNRRIIIASMHQKEQAIAPLLAKELGLVCFTDSTFNTDQYGTFSGEVQRQSDPIATARAKCLHAMQQNQCDLGIASEGSFGPHPALFFIPADEEFLIFIDQREGIEIIAKQLSTTTNYNGKLLKSEQDLLEFAHTAGFPSHGLILRPTADAASPIFKGITNQVALLQGFHQLREQYGEVYVETDMRAMYNPSRMEVIREATERLIQKIKSSCPQCDFPGFDVTSAVEGLKCQWCNKPTKSIEKHIYTCQKCHYAQEILHPYGKSKEDPMYCDHCNP